MLKKIIVILTILAAVLLIAYYGFLFYTKSFSPDEELKFSNGSLTVKVDYSRPYKKEREIFGSLVPYDSIWRTGANEATKIKVNQDVLVNGEPLPVGEYALFSIPRKDEWTLIFNREYDQWGAFYYRDEEDQLRVNAVAEESSMPLEQFTIRMEEKGKGLTLWLEWDNVKVPAEIMPN